MRLAARQGLECVRQTQGAIANSDTAVPVSRLQHPAVEQQLWRPPQGKGTSLPLPQSCIVLTLGLRSRLGLSLHSPGFDCESHGRDPPGHRWDATEWAPGEGPVTAQLADRLEAASPEPPPGSLTWGGCRSLFLCVPSQGISSRPSHSDVSQATKPQSEWVQGGMPWPGRGHCQCQPYPLPTCPQPILLPAPNLPQILSSADSTAPGHAHLANCGGCHISGPGHLPGQVLKWLGTMPGVWMGPLSCHARVHHHRGQISLTKQVPSVCVSNGRAILRQHQRRAWLGSGQAGISLPQGADGKADQTGGTFCVPLVALRGLLPPCTEPLPDVLSSTQ